MDELEYDVVVYGTGLVSSLLASSLIRRLNYSNEEYTNKNNTKENNSNKNDKSDNDKRKIKVLNVDKYGEYGNDYRTLTFKQLLSLENSQLVNSHDDLYNVKLGLVNKYLNQNESTEGDSKKQQKQKGNKVYYDLCPFWQTFNKLSSHHFLSEKQQDTKVEESPSKPTQDTVDKNNKVKEQKDNNVEENEKQNLELEIKNLFENSNLYNIDLYPRLILNNGLFLKYLINSNIYKQLQLCTNNNSNVLYLFENTVQSTTNENKQEEDKDDEGTKDKGNEKYEELMYDKNSIFRSNLLTNVEKRLLFRFLFHPNSVRSFDFESKKEGKNKNKENQEKDEEPPDHNTKQNNKEVDEKVVNYDTNKTFEEYLRDSGLTNKLMSLVNYGMCFNQKQLSDENPSNLYDEMFKLNQYIKTYGFGRDSKGINDVKNCFVYCLYGLSNLVQFICRLNSLHQCHHMLSNTVVSVSVSDYDGYSRNNSLSLSESESKNNDQQEEVNNNKENQEKDEEPDHNTKQNNIYNEDNKNYNNRLLMELDNYIVYTKYVVSEYDLTSVVEEFVPLENRKKYYLSQQHGVEQNNNKKVLVVSLISNKKLFDSFNVCVVVPGKYDEEDKDKYNRNEDTDEMEENENPMYVIQTCRDTLTSPEGMYVLYFTTLVEGDVYDAQIDVSNLFNYNGDDDSTECNSNEDKQEEDKDDEGTKDNKYRELRRVLNLYKYFTNDLSSIVFLSYTTFDYNNKIQLISLDNTLENDEGTKDKGNKDNKKYLKLIDNYYNNENILYISNELYVSDYVSNQILRLYKKENKQEEDKDDEGTKDKGNKDNKKYEVNLDNYLKYDDYEEDDEFTINCNFLSDLIDKFF